MNIDSFCRFYFVRGPILASIILSFYSVRLKHLKFLSICLVRLQYLYLFIHCLPQSYAALSSLDKLTQIYRGCHLWTSSARPWTTLFFLKSIFECFGLNNLDAIRSASIPPILISELLIVGQNYLFKTLWISSTLTVTT